MTFDELMGTVMQWATATQAMAALGAELSLEQSDDDASPEILTALRAVSTAAGIEGLADVPPPQQAMLAGFIRLFVHEALDLVDHPDRAPGWTFTDPAVLDGYGRGSSMIPQLIASAHPDLADVTSFLDVGTGVALLAVAAARVWPSATVVGVDSWGPSLERGRANVDQAGLTARITLRDVRVEDVQDDAAYDCVWIPTFFLTEADLEKGLTAAFRAAQPGGWVVLGRNRPMPDPLAAATAALKWTRAGGCSLEAGRAEELLEQAGFTEVHVAALPGPAPLELSLGQRPMG